MMNNDRGKTKEHANRESAETLKEKQIEERYRNLFEYADDAIFIMDGLKFTDCNPAAISIFRCDDKNDLVGHTPLDYMPEK